MYAIDEVNGIPNHTIKYSDWIKLVSPKINISHLISIILSSIDQVTIWKDYFLNA